MGFALMDIAKLSSINPTRLAWALFTAQHLRLDYARSSSTLKRLKRRTRHGIYRIMLLII